jgi:hypothetical protein
MANIRHEKLQTAIIIRMENMRKLLAGVQSLCYNSFIRE